MASITMSPAAVDLAEAHDRADDLAHRLDPLDPRQLLLAVVGLLGALPRAVLADVRFLVGDVVLLLLELALEDLGLLGPEPPVLRVIARIGLDLAVVQLQILVTTLSRK